MFGEYPMEEGSAATVPKTSDQSSWSGFYKKTLKERQIQLKLAFPELFMPKTSNTSPVVSSVYATPATSPTNSPISLDFSHNVYDSTDNETADQRHNFDILTSKLNLLNVTNEPTEAFPINGLDEDIADHMVENCIGTIGLPVGLALNFVINEKPIIIPMAIEEPSVVAAVSGAAKTISSCQGFTATASERNVVIAQISLLDIAKTSMDNAIQILIQNKSYIINVANQFCTNMVKRGGGMVDLTVRRILRPERNQSIVDSSKFEEWLIVHLHIDVLEAMGANCASTVAEGVAPLIAELTNARVGLKIVSNLSVERIAKASFRIPLCKLDYKNYSGKDVAQRILEALEWAEVDPYRAITHNKGIMNGIDAVAIATGQDWRAIEAAAHAWASMGNKDHSQFISGYRPLTFYWIEEDGELKAAGKAEDSFLMFCGELELPINVGTVGGVLRTNPVYAYNLGIMNNPDARGLAMAMVSVGLAQNFAALRALATEGIQRGHMALHAKNLVISAGCPPHAIAEITEKMVQQNRVSSSAAREFIEEAFKEVNHNSISPGKTRIPKNATNCNHGSFQTPLDCVHM